MNLFNFLKGLNPPQDLYANNLERAANAIENVNDANNDTERRNEEYNRERSNILNSLNWRTIIRRGERYLYKSIVYETIRQFGNENIRKFPKYSTSFEYWNWYDTKNLKVQNYVEWFIW